MGDWCITKNDSEVFIQKPCSPEAALDEEWEVMPQGICSTNNQNHQHVARGSKKKAFFNLMQTARTKLYNMYRSYPSEPPSFSCSTIYMLGALYQPHAQFEKNPLHSPQVQCFMEDFMSRIWFTYRSNFAPIEPSTITTDMGWGCMLRTGQMLLAQALSTFFLGREWRLRMNQTNAISTSMERKILRWFADIPTKESPYSIHTIAQLGTRFKKSIGEWFEPTIIARVLKILVRRHSPGQLTMYVPKDGVIYKDSIESLCCSDPHIIQSPPPSVNGFMDGLPYAKGTTPLWRPVIILIPVRLGVEKLNRLYIPTLKAFFSFPQSLGILGGKPDFSLYFVATQDDNVFYLDPHLVHETVDVDRPDFNTETFHCPIPQKMALADIDPSMAIGFLCKNRADFIDFCARIEKLNSASEGASVFEIEDYNREYKNENSSDDEDEGEAGDLPDDATLSDLLKTQLKTRPVEVGWKGVAEDYDTYLGSEDIAIQQSAYFNELLAEHFG
eukprot:TRINITY_DN3049_c0_g1_i2.p1 TRINITY_DN3049_c0_g1~~TRINITY_DN3049_c0_g1_i2.p1  ORF type:complete len:500 (-),score=77.23 TRINITY_DN3049_c0_g1_i2:99-1598(-)